MDFRGAVIPANILHPPPVDVVVGAMRVRDLTVGLHENVITGRHPDLTCGVNCLLLIHLVVVSSEMKGVILRRWPLAQCP